MIFHLFIDTGLEDNFLIARVVFQGKLTSKVRQELLKIALHDAMIDDVKVTLREDNP